MNQPVVTVLMPVYNSEKYLKESIESILNQTFSSFELLIINDGSTDRSKKIIESYNDDRIRFFENERNLGMVVSFNKGLELARGKYLARMDSDDIAFPTRLEKQVKFMDNNPVVGLIGSWFEYYPSKTIVRTPTKHEEIYATFFKYNAIAHPSTMFRLKIILDNKLFYNPDYEPAEDFELWSRLIAISKVANIPDVLLSYRLHENQISNHKSIVQLRSSTQTKINLYGKLINNKVYRLHKILEKLNVDKEKITNEEFCILTDSFDEAYKAVKAQNCIDSRLFLFHHISMLKTYLAQTKSPRISLLKKMLNTSLFHDSCVRQKMSLTYRLIKYSF